jgi:hypothetical protein
MMPSQLVKLVTQLVLVVLMVPITVVLVALPITTYIMELVLTFVHMDSSLTTPLCNVNHVTTHVLAVLNLPLNVVLVKKVSSYLTNYVSIHVQSNIGLIKSKEPVKLVTKLVGLVLPPQLLNTDNVLLVPPMMIVYMDNIVPPIILCVNIMKPSVLLKEKSFFPVLLSVPVANQEVVFSYTEVLVTQLVSTLIMPILLTTHVKNVILLVILVSLVMNVLVTLVTKVLT